jgi:hypothetical protein
MHLPKVSGATGAVRDNGDCLLKVTRLHGQKGHFECFLE